MQPNQDVSLDEITQVINKLQFKLKDDRLSQQLRNSNVTTVYEQQRPPRYYQEYVNQVPTNYHQMRHQPQQQQQIPQQIVYQQFQPELSSPSQKLPMQGFITIPSASSYQPQPVMLKPSPQSSNPQLLHKIKILEDKLSQYQQFQRSVQQNTKRNQQHFDKLINIVNYQQSEILSLQSQNNQIQYELRQNLQVQKVFEEELASYKCKVVGLERMLGNGVGGNRRDEVVEKVGGKNQVFKEMMKGVEGVGKRGSPGWAGGITLSSGKKLN